MLFSLIIKIQFFFFLKQGTESNEYHDAKLSAFPFCSVLNYSLDKQDRKYLYLRHFVINQPLSGCRG